MIYEVRVASKYEDLRGDSLLREIKRTLNIQSITSIRTSKLYRFEGVSLEEAEKIAQVSLTDPVHEECRCNSSFNFNAQRIIEVGYKPGVMNPEVASITGTIQALGIASLQAAETSWEYHFCGELSDEQLNQILNRLLVNKTVAQVIVHPPKTLRIQGATKSVATIPLATMSDEQFADYSKDNQLFLSDEERAAIRHYFSSIARDPYDGELETIAQTWSEHCLHKTFKAPLEIDGEAKEPLFKRLKNSAEQYNASTVSAFDDNAGVFRFYDGHAIAAKVETHNSPSALEPYGGAATGSGGVFRDIMGTGQGAHVIASTDMFCFAPPDMDASDIPHGCLHPDYLLRHVVAGVRDYGNRMGIPTNNGSVHFHEDFRAKPTVIVGAYGIIPEFRSAKGVPRIGDRIFVVGGKTGRDGIHGATFSSDAMTHETSSVNATAVQIGNPIEQKRMADALLSARDADLICAITDCGAGGFSSAIGEMAQEVGAKVALEHAPLKYSGLAPWEIWVSESQERMICAIDPQHADQFIALCAEFNVTATDIGYFTGSKKLEVCYQNQMVCDLEMDFLHNGCPIPLLSAIAPEKEKQYDTSYEMPASSEQWIDRLCAVLAHGNVCSKEPIARQYDHTVQGMNALQSYAGTNQNAPQDAAVMVPLYGKPYGLIISHGMNPILNRIDPYAGSIWAITEALANLVAVGGNPQDAALIDNFIWPKPEGEFLWALDRAMEACVDAMERFKIPFISGKDSLSSTYRFADGDSLHIPPVLCISAFGKIPNITTTISSDLKQDGSLLLLIGELDVPSMGGSVYEQTMNIKSNFVPYINLEKTANRFAKLHQLINDGMLLSCHDVSEGGVITAVTEMCIGGNLGAHLIAFGIGHGRLDQLLFNETAGCFMAEVSPQQYATGAFSEIEHCVIGQTTTHDFLYVMDQDELLFSLPIAQLKQAWQQPLQRVFS